MAETPAQILAAAAFVFAMFAGLGVFFHGFNVVTIIKHYHCNCKQHEEEEEGG